MDRRGENQLKINEIKTCMNTYGACDKRSVPIVYARREGKEFVTTNFCSKECFELYKKGGSRKLTQRVYDKQRQEYDAFLKKNGPEDEKPHSWTDKDTGITYDCSFPIPKEKLKDKVTLDGITYILDKSGKFPEYKLSSEVVTEDDKVWEFNKKWLAIDPNKVDKKLLGAAVEKLENNWLKSSLNRWKKLLETTLENHLYQLHLKPKQLSSIKRFPNKGKYWKSDYIGLVCKSLPEEILLEIRYYLLVETYQELYNPDFVKDVESDVKTFNGRVIVRRKKL